jgi:hypothetical protein
VFRAAAHFVCYDAVIIAKTNEQSMTGMVRNGEYALTFPAAHATIKTLDRETELKRCASNTAAPYPF